MLANQFHSFLFDLDGVIYIEGEVLPGVVESIRRLREEGKQIRFLTNDPRPQRTEIVEKLSNMGVDTATEEVATSGWATAEYLANRNTEKVFVVGSDGLRAEMQNAGMQCVGKDQAEAVVVGSDIEVGYRDIFMAAMQIHGGAQFIATNIDATFPTSRGPAPATGSIVAAIETAVSRPPEVIGKPEPHLFTASLKGLDKSRAVMIGDTPESDIAGATRAGITSILMKSDQHNGHPASLESGMKADYTITSLIELFGGK